MIVLQIHDPKTFDYPGLLGVPVGALTLIEKDAWRHLRDWMVYGHPVNDLPKRENRFLPSGIKRGHWQIKTLDNLPKYIKVRIPEGLGKSGSQYNPYDHLHAMYPREVPEGGKSVVVDEMMAKFEAGIKKVTTADKNARLRSGLNAYDEMERMPILGFDPAFLGGKLNGGIRSGEFSMPILGRPTKTMPYSLILARRLAEQGKPIRICLEEPEFQHDWERLEWLVCDSLPTSPKQSSNVRVMKHRSLDKAHYHLNWSDRFVYRLASMDDDALRPSYEKERKKYKHKDAVNRILKKYRGDRKEAARSLERVGAQYEEEQKAKKHADKSAE